MHKFTVTEKQLLQGIQDVILELDCDDLACLAEDLLGGDINYDVNKDVYTVSPNQEYFGGLDSHDN